MNRPPHGLFPVVINRMRSAIAIAALGWLPLVFLGVPMATQAQFKEVGPPPLPPAAARQKIRTLLETVDPGNPQRSVDALLALVPWYRDLVDQELIAAWQRDGRSNLTPVIEPLADAAVASAIVEYSWRQAPQATLNLATAPLLGELMARYPDSATPFLSDLLAPSVSSRPPLSNAEAEAVCRILLDMPDVGTWRKSALQILPRYRQTAERLLAQDVHGDDREKAYRALMWQRELGGDEPGIANRPLPRRKPAPMPPSPAAGGGNATPAGTAPPPTGIANGRPTLARAEPEPPSAASLAAPAAVRAPAAPPSLYNGARSGTLQCAGGPIPQNAEYVFRDLPAGKLQLDYNAKTWDARLAPGEGQTQKLILTNKSSGPQKRCVVHWSLLP